MQDGYSILIIGPESDHWLPFSVTDSNSCLEDLVDVTLACEYANSKFVEFVTVADVDDEKCFDDSFRQFWKLKFGHKAKFCSDFEYKVQSRV